MFIVFPILSYFAWLAVFRHRVWLTRERVLIAAVWWALCLVSITELLSAFHSITDRYLAVTWGITALLTWIGASILNRGNARTPMLYKADATPQVSGPLSKADKLIFASILSIILLIGVTAILAAPNGFDVVEYHMPRVIQWAAQRSIGLFPTNYYVEDFAPPLTEWIFLHIYLLSGSDRLIDMVQWLAFAGSAIASSLIAREFGCKLRGQLIAAFLVVTIPEGILSASGAKNDWVVALWLIICVWTVLRWYRTKSWLYVATLGVSIGMLLLTKGTAYAFGPPILLALLAVAPREYIWKRLPLALILVIVIAGLINAPQWSRNYRLGHSIFGLNHPDVAGDVKYTVDHVNATEILANTIRKTSDQFGAPAQFLTDKATNASRAIISGFGVDPDDPTQIRSDQKFYIHAYSLDEYYAGNPLDILLIVISFGILLVTFCKGDRYLKAIAIGIFSGYLLYCAVFRWEISDPRRLIVVFVVACPVVAVILSRLSTKVSLTVLLVLGMTGVPDLFFNGIRPLISTAYVRRALHYAPDPSAGSVLFRSRSAMYFGENTELEPRYFQIATYVRGITCSKIGLDTTNHPYSYDYVLIALINADRRSHVFRYTGVRNLTSKYASEIDRTPPCAVICVMCSTSTEKWRKYQATLPIIQTFGTFAVFSQAGGVTKDWGSGTSGALGRKMEAIKNRFGESSPSGRSHAVAE